MEGKQMTEHMAGTLRKLANGDGTGYHFGTLKALVKRGLTECVPSHDCYGYYGLQYRITESGLKIVMERNRGQ